MRSISLVFLLVIALQTLSKPLVANKVIIALNCGSKDQQVQSFDKLVKYKADETFVKGKSVDVDYHTNEEAKENDIKYTFDKRLYMYERHTYEEMTYSLPSREGKVTLILKFAEMYFRNAGERVFNIKLGSKVVRQDFDVVQKSGGRFSAHQEYIQVEVKPDGLYYGGQKVPGGLVNKKIILSFAKGRNDNPIVQGILVYHDSLENSPQDQFLEMKRKWETQKQIQRAMKQQAALKEILAVQKKKEKIVIRNDQLIVETQEEVAEKGPAREKFNFIRRLLMSPIGILGWGALFAAVGFLAYTEVFKMKTQSKLSKPKQE